MSTISIQLQSATAAGPTPVATKTVVVTDSAGASQSVTLNGSESPVGFIPSATVASGAGNIVVTDLDASGNPVGSPITSPYTTTGTVAGTQFPTIGVTVTVLTP
jgi:hypothetical protein